jgi:light-regulated signal transduction histidine kinase (bacteriophytochrome)
MVTDTAGNQIAVIIRLRDLSVRQYVEADPNKAPEHKIDPRMSAVDLELESFIYSVSHDLQAPLRHIKGFSALLEDEYSELLKGEGSDYIERVHQACDRMQQQLSDLLQLSRNTRGRMFPSRINLGDIARAVLDEYHQNEPDRNVKITISGNLEAEGDQRLLLVMMRHLLDNAWKFTRERDPAEISFGVQEFDDGRIFFIRDNGTGFDRSVADKLFLPFRRFHGDEYEGHGIGLATALRIINRHEGKIWIESKPDSGTTCYFTLS